MLRAERNDDGIVGGGGLQLEIEGTAKTFAEGQAPGAVEASAERGVDDQLHAARLIEETLHDKRVLRRERAERFVGSGEIIGELARGGVGEVVFGLEPVGERVGWSAEHRLGTYRIRTVAPIRRSAFQNAFDILAQMSDGMGEFVGSGGSFAEPEGDARRLAVSVFHANSAGDDL